MQIRTRKITTPALALAAVMAITGGLARGEPGTWSMAGSAGMELRWYPDDPAYTGQLTDLQASLHAQPEFRFRSGSRRHFASLVPFLRVDSQDKRRTHFDLREASWRHVGERAEVLVGVNRVFWGVTESRHLVDTINQVDLVEDVDEEDRLGQPMVQLSFQRDWGRMDAFLLLGFRERTFPGEAGRLRPSLVVDVDGATYGPGAGRHNLDLALRWSHYIGDWDLGVHAFHGTGREPVLVPDGAGQRLLPLYLQTNQIGVDVQYTRGAWLWKLESLVREGQGSTFAAGVAGFEYTLYQVGKSALDVGLLAEYLRDGRDAEAPFTIFQDDLFAGVRLAFNDLQDTSILAGAVVDRELGSVAVRLEAERRLGTRVVLGVEGRWFTHVDVRDPLALFRQDSFLAGNIAFHF